MAGRTAPNNQKMNSRALKENDTLLLSPSSGLELMQNCDLPPPLKVFPGSDKTIMSSMNRVFSMMGREHDHAQDDFDVYNRGCGGENYEKLELLKALRLSQTRAREAERKAASLIKERDCVANAFLHESFQLFAYRQWVRLLEFQVLKTKAQWQQQENKLCYSFCRSKEVKDQLEEEEEGEGEGSDGSWINVAVTFCLGIFGLGLAFGYCYLL